MMKRASIMILLAVLLVSLMLSLVGCSSGEQPGETLAEGHRRHIRNVRLDSQGFMKDIDTIFLTDEPSRLSERRFQ